MNRSLVALLAFAVLLACTRLPGDEPRQPAEKPAPFPRYYRKLGLDRDQTDKVRKTRARFRSRMEELRRQLRALEKEEDAELEKLLTDAQKARLKDLRAQGPGEFKISGPRLPIRVQRGKSTTFAVELSHDMAFEGDVTLTFDLPKGVKIQPSPFVFKEGGDAIGELTISTDKDMDSQEYRIIIQATPDNGDPIEVTVRLLVTL